MSDAGCPGSAWCQCVGGPFCNDPSRREHRRPCDHRGRIGRDGQRCSEDPCGGCTSSTDPNPGNPRWVAPEVITLGSGNAGPRFFPWQKRPGAFGGTQHDEFCDLYTLHHGMVGVPNLVTPSPEPTARIDSMSAE